MHSKKYVLLLFVLFIGSAQIKGQIEIDRLGVDDLVLPEKDNLLSVDVTTASKSAESIENAPGIISVVTATEIEKFGASNLLEVLERVTSVYTAGTFYIQQNYISIRGDLSSEYNNHTLILINGRPTRENFLGGVDFSVFFGFPLSSINRIEVIRGPGSVLYGSNAYSGVVNIITKEIQDNETNIEAGYGSFNTFNFGVHNTQIRDDLKFRSAIKYRRQEGWRFSSIGEGSVIFGPDSAGNNVPIGVDRDTADFDMGETTLGGLISIEYRNLTFNGLLSYSTQNHYGALPIANLLSPLPPALIPAENIVNTLSLNRSRNREISSFRSFMDFTYESSYASNANFTISATYNSQYTRFAAPPGDAVIDTKDLLIESTNFLSPLKNLNWLIGATAYVQGGQANTGDNPAIGAANYSEVWYSGYTQIDYSPVKYLKLILGGQLNKPAGIDLDFVPRFGAIITATKNLGAKILLGSAFRAPFQAEQTLFDPGALVGSQSLRPETVSTLDAQVFYDTKKLQLAFTYFRSTQQDLITRVPASSLTPAEIGIAEDVFNSLAPSAATFTNANRLNLRGFEFETKFNPNDRLFVSASVTSQTNTLNDTLDGFTLAPQFMAKVGVFYNLRQGISLGVFDSYFSAAGTATSATEVNPVAESFHFVTAKIQVDIVKIFSNKAQNSFIFSLYATNLLNQDIYYPEYVRRSINTVPGRGGRAIYGNIIYRF